MAKIVITLEDTDKGVKVQATPNFETMMAMDASGNSLTNAHGYALFMLNTLWRETKKRTSKLNLYLPTIGRS